MARIASTVFAKAIDADHPSGVTTAIPTSDAKVNASGAPRSKPDSISASATLRAVVTRFGSTRRTVRAHGDAFAPVRQSGMLGALGSSERKNVTS